MPRRWCWDGVVDGSLRRPGSVAVSPPLDGEECTFSRNVKRFESEGPEKVLSPILHEAPAEVGLPNVEQHAIAPDQEVPDPVVAGMKNSIDLEAS